MQTVRISQVARNSDVAAFLARGEHDNGAAFAVPASPRPVLAGGAAVKVPEHA